MRGQLLRAKLKDDTGQYDVLNDKAEAGIVNALCRDIHTAYAMVKVLALEGACALVESGIAELFTLVCPDKLIGLYDVDTELVKEAQKLRYGETKLSCEIAEVGGLVLRFGGESF